RQLRPAHPAHRRARPCTQGRTGHLLPAGQELPRAPPRALPARAGAAVPSRPEPRRGGRLMRAVHALAPALPLGGPMPWEVLWALILGFALSAVVQALVPRETVP